MTSATWLAVIAAIVAGINGIAAQVIAYLLAKNAQRVAMASERVSLASLPRAVPPLVE